MLALASVQSEASTGLSFSSAGPHQLVVVVLMFSAAPPPQVIGCCVTVKHGDFTSLHINSDPCNHRSALSPELSTMSLISPRSEQEGRVEGFQLWGERSR